MEKFVYLSFVVIFISMLFILLLFQNFSNMSMACTEGSCSDVGIMFTMMFGFFITGAFVVIDFIVIHIMLREKPWSVTVNKGKPVKHKQGGKAAALEKELKRINRAKAEAEKSYYKGRLDTETFKKMLDKYEQRGIELKADIRDVKSRKKKGRRKGK